MVVYPGEYRVKRHHRHRDGYRNVDYRYGQRDRYENHRDCDRERDDEFGRDGYRRRH